MIIYIISQHYGWADNIKGILTCARLAHDYQHSFTIYIPPQFHSLQLDRYIHSSFLSPTPPPQIWSFKNNNEKSNMWNWVHQYLSNTDECLGIQTNIQPFWFFHDILNEYTICCQSDMCTWYHNEFWKIFTFPSVQDFLQKKDVTIHIRRGDLCFHHSFSRRIQCVKYYIETFLPCLEKLSFSENTTVRLFSDCCIIVLSDAQSPNNISVKKGQTPTHFQYMSTPQQIEHMMDEFHQLIQSSIIYTSGNSGFSFYAALAGSRHYIPFFLE